MNLGEYLRDPTLIEASLEKDTIAPGDSAEDGAEDRAPDDLLLVRSARVNAALLERTRRDDVARDGVEEYIDNKKKLVRYNFFKDEHHGGKDVWLSRKGAISAREGEAGLIPGSMGTASYVVEGRGNPDALHSAPHGAIFPVGKLDGDGAEALEHGDVEVGPAAVRRAADGAADAVIAQLAEDVARAHGLLDELELVRILEGLLEDVDGWTRVARHAAGPPRPRPSSGLPW